MEIRLGQDVLQALNLRLDTLESALVDCDTHKISDPHLIRELVTKTLEISLEISSYAKKSDKDAKSILTLANLLKRQSFLLRSVCRIQRESFTTNRKTSPHPMRRVKIAS